MNSKVCILFIVLGCFVSENRVRAQTCTSCSSTGWVLTVPIGVAKTYSVSSISGSNYVWIVTGGLEVVSGQGTSSVSVLPNTSGQLCVTRYKNGSGSCTDCAQINVIPPPAIPSTLSISVNTCIAITGSVNVVPGATSYKWYADNVLLSTSTGTSYTIQFSSYPALKNGSHDLCVEAFNQFGVPSVSKLCKAFIGCPPPTAPTFLTFNIDPCRSIETLTSTVPFATNYQWFIDNVFYSRTTGTSILIQFAENVGLGNGTHSICVLAENGSGVSSKVCKSYSSVCLKPQVPGAVTTKILDNCGFLQASVKKPSDGVITDYSWYVDGVYYGKGVQLLGNALISIQLNDYPFLGNGTHTVCVEAINPFGVSSQSCTNYASTCPPPSKPGSISLTIDNCETIQGTINKVSNATGYKWFIDGAYVGPGIPISGISMLLIPVASYTNGTHQICVEAFNDFGKSLQSCKSFSINCNLASRTDGDNVFNHSLIVYPNPAKNEIEISFEDNLESKEKVSIQFLTKSGELIKTVDSESRNIRVPIASLPKGLYMLRISINGKITTRQVVID